MFLFLSRCTGRLTEHVSSSGWKSVSALSTLRVLRLARKLALSWYLLRRRMPRSEMALKAEKYPGSSSRGWKGIHTVCWIFLQKLDFQSKQLRERDC